MSTGQMMNNGHRFLEVTFLGTGTSQGVPVIACDCQVCCSQDKKDKRLRSSVHLKTDKVSLNIDCGPDFRYQMLKNKIKNLDAILFTHAHKDHTGGLDDIRAFNFIQKKDMLVFADQPTEQTLRQQYDYIFKEHPYPGIPKVHIKQINKRSFTFNGLKIIPIQAFHYKMPVLGFRIGDFTYLTDANHIPPEELTKMIGSKVLVLNALRKEKHISHFTLDEAIQIVEQIQPEKAFFTHISHQLGKHQEVSASLPENISLAYDGLKVRIEF